MRVPETTGLGAGAGLPGGEHAARAHSWSSTLRHSVDYCQRKSQVGGLGNPSQGWKFPKSLILGKGRASLGLFPVQGPGAAAGDGPGSHLLGAHPSGPPTAPLTGQ